MPTNDHRKLLAELEDLAAAAVDVALRNVARRFAVALRRMGAVSADDAAVVRSMWVDEIDGPLVDAVEAAQELGVTAGEAQLGIPAGRPPLALREALEGARNRLARVGDEVWQHARAQLVEGVELGESIPKLAKRISRLPDLAGPRATVVARTEVVSASNKATLAVARDRGVATVKTWLATDDDRTRESHAAAEADPANQRIPMDHPFTVGGWPADYPGDPGLPPDEAINCRCTVVVERDPAAEQDQEVPLAAAATEEETIVPWSKVKGGGDCGDDQWAVLKDSDGSTAGCHDTEEEADAQLAALYASEPDAAVELLPLVEGPTWEGVIAIEGKPTEEAPAREFAPGSLTWERLPIVLQWEKEGTHGGDHSVTVPVGSVDEIERRDGGEIWGRGRLSTSSPDALTVTEMMREGFVRWVSIVPDGISDADVELVMPDEPPAVEDEEIEDLLFGPTPETVIFHAGRIRAVTLVDIAAFIDAVVTLEEPLEVSSANETASENTSVTADTSSNRCLECGSVLAVAGGNGGRVRGDRRRGDESGSASSDVRSAGRSDSSGVDDRSSLSATAVLQSSASGTGDDVGELAASAEHQRFQVVAHDALHQRSSIRRDEHGHGETSQRRDLQDVSNLPSGKSVTSLRSGPGAIQDLSAGIPADEAQLIAAGTHTLVLHDRPPAWWFNEPTDETPHGALTVTDEGRLYGYLAPSNVGHISPLFRGRTVPLGTDYSRFHRGEVVCEGGERVVAGNVTMGCNHAPRVASVPEIEQFENTCAVFGRVRVGENRHGAWVAGYVLPGVTADMVERAMGCQLSGYWRPKESGGGVELFSALLVPVPGFPMGRSRPSVRVRNGAMVSSAVPVRFEDGHLHGHDFAMAMAAAAGGGCGCGGHVEGEPAITAAALRSIVSVAEQNRQRRRQAAAALAARIEAGV
jgi:hypothetical protein